jgi:PhnB protein
MNPYLTFKDNARQAMQFYKDIFVDKLTMTTFKENHVSQDPNEENNILHAELEAPNDIRFMAADTLDRMGEYQPGLSISITLTGDNHAELKDYYDKLMVGGQVEQPLEEAPWGNTFGMLVEKFGTHWMVSILHMKKPTIKAF